MANADVLSPPNDLLIAEWLRVFIVPGQTFELRAPKAQLPGRKKPSNLSRLLVADDDLIAAAHEARKLSARAPGVYFTLNPVRADLEAGRSATDGDILARRWLLLDFDPTRPADVSATDAEKAAAAVLGEEVRNFLMARGWPAPVRADSGNGRHLLYLVDLPADDGGLVKRVLEALAARFDTPTCTVDRKVFNPSRICKVYGTEVRKGEATAERPHRFARVLEVPEALKVVTREQLEAIVEELTPPPVAPPLDMDAEIERKRSRGANGKARPDAEARAVAYLARCEPAISGQDGHGRAFKVAVAIGPGFDLAPDVAYRLLAQHFNPRCVPPWSDRELRHKVDEAYKVESERGWLLRAERNGTHAANGKAPEATPAEGRVVEALDDPHRLARLYLEKRCRHRDGATLRYWQGEWARWDLAYRPVLEGAIRAEVASVAKAEFNRLNRLEVKEWEARGKTDAKGVPCPAPAARKVTGALVSNVTLALSGYQLLDAHTPQPSWLEGSGPFPAEEVLPTENALVHLPTVVDGGDATRSPSPAFFCPYVLDYRFNASAPEPVNWLTFLGARPVDDGSAVTLQLWPDDAEAIATLQEWFGYHLTPDTRQQKIAAIIGPKRSGKGTISRILKSMIGPSNVGGPTFSSLATNFGLAPLIGKPCAIIPDARVSGRSDRALIVERLLAISGEDHLTIDRKHLPSWEGKLPTRLTIISNELPRLSDSSGALAGRLIILRLTRSFYGNEDERLTDLLLSELPGILLWAIEGWARLRDRGRFVQPESGRELVEMMEDLSSPVGLFLSERCRIEPNLEVKIEDLFNAWKDWCASKNRSSPGTEQELGQNLHAAIPTLRTIRPWETDGPRKRVYRGIGLCDQDF